MGQKVNPTGIRLGIVKDHASVWYAERGAYADKLNNDLEVRSFLEERLKNASVSRIHIERPANNARITIHTARPGIVIGKKGEDVDRLRRDLTEMMGVPVHVNIEEVRKPELDAKLVAANVAGQLERRVMFRRAMKRAVQNAMRLGAGGIRFSCQVVWVVPKSHVPNGTAKVAFRCTLCVRTLTTPLTKLTPPTASSASKCGSSRVKSSAVSRKYVPRLSNSSLPATRPRRKVPGKGRASRCYSPSV